MAHVGEILAELRNDRELSQKGTWACASYWRRYDILL